MTGQEIIDRIMAERRVGPKDFFSRTRLPHAVKARRDAIKALKAAGMSNADVARLMRRDPSTVSYWAAPGRRARRKADGLAYWHSYRAAYQ